MAGRIPAHGDYVLPEQADIPQWEIDRERRAARAQLRAVLHRGGSDEVTADRLAHRVVPERSAYVLIERARRQAALADDDTDGL